MKQRKQGKIYFSQDKEGEERRCQWNGVIGKSHRGEKNWGQVLIRVWIEFNWQRQLKLQARRTI